MGRFYFYSRILIITLVLIATRSMLSAQPIDWGKIGSDIIGEATGDQSGKSVAVSSDGTVVAIGAPFNDGGAVDAGSVRIFKNQSGSWVQLGTDIDGEAIEEHSGRSVSLSSDGSIVAIGEPGTIADKGRVRIYEYLSGSWIQIGDIIDGEAAGDNFGICVSLSSDGTKVAIGANLNDGGGANSGHVRIYENQSGAWVQVGVDINGEAAGDYAGWSVSLSSDGSIVAIGAYLNDGNGTDSGNTRIYKYISGSWQQMGADINGEAAGDKSGSSVSLSSDGSILAVGAYDNDGNGTSSGHVRIFKYQSGSWIQIGSDIDGTVANGQSGKFVDINSDGSVVAIGAPLYKAGSFASAGQVRIFHNENGSWVQTGSEIVGTATNEYCGFSVALSSSGTVAAVGIYGNSGDKGLVQIYENCTTYSNLNETACVSYTSPSGKYTWTTTGVYKDTIANLAECDSVITISLTVDDIINPTAVCKDTTVYLDGSGAAAITAGDIDGGSTDNCALGTLSADQTSFGCADVGDVTVTLTVPDAKGNISTCTSTVTVSDTIAPVATCNNFAVYLDAAGSASITVADIDNGSTDNCSLDILTASQTSFGCADVGDVTVTLTVPDVNGNISTCDAIVTVSDTISPVAVCQNITVYLDGTGSAVITGSSIDNGSTDNCTLGILTASQTSFDCSNLGDVAVTLTVNDVNGNSSTCSSTITIADTIPPVAICNDITVLLDDSGNAVITASDIDGGSSDNCSIESLSASQTSFTTADIGMNAIVLTVTDGSGNSSTCQANVKVINDNVAPNVVCNSIDIYLNKNGEYTINAFDRVDLSKGTTDNVDPYKDLKIVTSPTKFGCEDVGSETTISVYAIDKAGNWSSCKTFITVIDTFQLEVSPVENVLVELEAGVCETTITYPEIVSPTICASVEKTEGLGPDGVFPIGTTVETWIVTNTSGDTIEVSFNVTVTSANALPTLDTIADVTAQEDDATLEIMLDSISYGIDCINQDITVTASGMNPALVTDIAINYTSPDSTATLSLTIAPDMSGTDTITVIVTDSEGASVTESFVVTIIPVNDPPVVVNPIPDVVVNASYVLKVPVSDAPGDIFKDVDDDAFTLELYMEDGSDFPEWITIVGDTLVCTPMIADTGCVSIVVKATDASGGMAADTFKVCVDGYPTGNVNLDVVSFDVQMYPNPTKGVVNLKINSSEILDSEVIVRNIAGSEVFRKDYRAAELITVDLSNHVSGIYLVTLKTGDKSVVKKLILDRK